MKKLVFFVVILAIAGTCCVLYATIMQCVLCYEKFGVIFNSDDFFIPHKSAWFYLGGIGLVPITVWPNK